MVLRDIPEGVGCHRAHAPAVHQHLGHGVARVRRDGKGLLPTLADGGPAGRGDGPVGAGGRPDGVIGAVLVAAVGLVIQFDLTAEGGVVAVRRGEAPRVGRVGLHAGAARQHVPRVVHPLQHAVRRGDGAAGQRQRRVVQRLAAGDDPGVVGLAGGSGLGDGDDHRITDSLLVVLVLRLGDRHGNDTHLHRREKARIGVDDGFAGAVGHGVGHLACAGAAAAAQLQRLTVDHGGAAGDAQRRLIVLLPQEDVQRDGEVLIVGTGCLEGDGDLVAQRLPLGDRVGQETAVRRKVLPGQHLAGVAVERPLLSLGKRGPVRRVGVFLGVRVLLHQLHRPQVPAVCRAHGDIDGGVDHSLIVVAVGSEVGVEALVAQLLQRRLRRLPAPCTGQIALGIHQLDIAQPLPVLRRQTGGLRIVRRCLLHHELHSRRGEFPVVIRLADDRVHVVGTGVQRGGLHVLPPRAAKGGEVGHCWI